MDAPTRRRRTALWIRDLVGDRTLTAAAAEISSVTGWSLDHSRLSRYSNPEGTAHIGPEVVAHFRQYAEAKGLPDLDFTDPAPALSLEERAVVAAERQATALELIAYHLMGGTAPDRAGLDAMQAMFEQLRSTYRPPRPDPAPAAGR